MFTTSFELNATKCKALLNALPDAQLVFKQDGTIIYANASAKEFFGYSSEELMKMNRSDLFDNAEFQLTELTKLSDHQKRAFGKLTAIKKNKHTTLVTVFSTGFFDETSDEYLIIKTIKDPPNAERIDQLLTKTNSLAKLGIWEYNLITNELLWTKAIKEIHEVEDDFIPDLKNGINFYYGAVSKNSIQLAVKRTIETGVGFDLNLEIKTAKGNIKQVNATGEAVSEAGNIIRLVGTFRDITKKQNIQYSLVKSYNDLSKIMDTSLDIISVVNEEGEFIQLNNAVERIWGYSIVDLIGKKNTDLVIPEDLQKTFNVIEKLKRGEEIINFENTYRHKNGKLVSMSWSATIDTKTKLRYAIGRDITDKVDKEKQLKLLESVITNTNDSVIITEASPIDKPGPLIIYVNEAFEKMTQYSKAEVIGKSPRILQGPDTSKKDLYRLKQHLENWQVCETEVINYKKDGQPFWINFTVVPVADENGWYTHWIAIQKDVTERKKLEVEKNRLINELVGNNKDLKQFSYITSHNLRAPVTNLLALIKLFDWSEIKNDENRSLLQSFEKSTIQLNESINDLLYILVLKEKKFLIQNQLIF